MWRVCYYYASLSLRGLSSLSLSHLALRRVAELVPPGGRLPFEPDANDYPSRKDLEFEYRSTGAEDAINDIANYYGVRAQPTQPLALFVAHRHASIARSTARSASPRARVHGHPGANGDASWRPLL